jgi:hypothetical protein
LSLSKIASQAGKIGTTIVSNNAKCDLRSVSKFSIENSKGVKVFSSTFFYRNCVGVMRLNLQNVVMASSIFCLLAVIDGYNNQSMAATINVPGNAGTISAIQNVSIGSDWSYPALVDNVELSTKAVCPISFS